MLFYQNKKKTHPLNDFENIYVSTIRNRNSYAFFLLFKFRSNVTCVYAYRYMFLGFCGVVKSSLDCFLFPCMVAGCLTFSELRCLRIYVGHKPIRRKENVLTHKGLF